MKVKMLAPCVFLSFFVMAMGMTNLRRIDTTPLPDKIVVGYANWMECDEKLVTAVAQGVNVLIWFSINLVVNSEGVPMISGGPPRKCVQSIKDKIQELNLETVHLISIGGWNSPHPDTSNSPSDVYHAWVEWNDGLFDGFDWDVEGNDDPLSPYNHFTVACLDLMGEMSQLAKSNGYVVSMAPAESYLDMTTSVFDLDLNHSYPEWSILQPNFNYHGHNVYAYLLVKFGQTQVTISSQVVDKDNSLPIVGDKMVPTFDFITIQLYEGYSHAEYNTTISMQRPQDYLVKFVHRVSTGWNVDFGSYLQDSDSAMTTPSTSEVVSVPTVNLVIGLANGWAGDGKFILIYPSEVS